LHSGCKVKYFFDYCQENPDFFFLKNNARTIKKGRFTIFMRKKSFISKFMPIFAAQSSVSTGLKERKLPNLFIFFNV